MAPILQRMSARHQPLSCAHGQAEAAGFRIVAFENEWQWRACGPGAGTVWGIRRAGGLGPISPSYLSPILLLEWVQQLSAQEGAGGGAMFWHPLIAAGSVGVNFMLFSLCLWRR